MTDLSKYKKNNKIYTGAEEKIGITIDGEDYLVKFRKKGENGEINNHLSEYIGSSVFALLGEDVQETILATYQGRMVCVCKDFIIEGETFTPFNGVGESSLERDKNLYRYTYAEIIDMLNENTKLTSVKQNVDKFWNMFIIDALLGNFDRHGANWGFIKDKNGYRLAPIFDNGSCLFPRRATDELMLEALNNEQVRQDLIFKYPTSQIKFGKSKSSYFEIINKLKFPKCNEALVRIYQKYDKIKINKFIDNIDVLTNIQKKFYKQMLDDRFEYILKASYLKLMEKK